MEQTPQLRIDSRAGAVVSDSSLISNPINKGHQSPNEDADGQEKAEREQGANHRSCVLHLGLLPLPRQNSGQVHLPSRILATLDIHQLSSLDFCTFERFVNGELSVVE